MDPNWNSHPLITSICLVNKGCLFFTDIGWLHMNYDKKTGINEEIIAYLSTILHGLRNVEESRRVPRIGYYLSNSYKMDKIKNEKK